VEQPVSGRLAQLARDTVEAADRAQLAIYGGQPGPDNPVQSLYTDNGWPVFWCDLNSATAVAAAENRAAKLTVSALAGPETVTVRLAGRLELIGTGLQRGQPIGAVTLAVTQVQVETRAPGGPALTRPVPLSDYAGTTPAALAARARQLAAHANDAHGRELRRLAAARAGVPVGQIAAAWLTSLDSRAAQLAWIGPSGADTLTATFPRPARTATELALLLRALLTGAAGRQ
jgi:hypothetical protein